MSEDLVPLERVLEPVNTANFTEEQVMVALTSYSKNGTATRACQQLETVGIKVTPQTLRHWRKHVYPQRYAHVQETYRQDLEEAIPRVALDSFHRLAAASDEVLERIEDNIPKIDVRDLSQTLRNIEAAKGQNLNEFFLATGRPTAHVMTRSVDENLMLLKGLVEGETIDGEGEEE